MVNSKKKGNRGENLWANWLRDNNICKAYRNSSSGANIVKSDVTNNLGMNFEVKSVKKLNLMEAWKQSERDAAMSHTIPTLVIHFDGMPQDSWLVVMNNYDWADLIKGKNEPAKQVATKTKQSSNEYLKTAIRLKSKEIIDLINKVE